MILTSTVEQLSDGKAVIELSGPLSLGTSLKVLDSQIQNLIAGEVSDVLLDLSKVDYADSAGLGMLVHTYGLLKKKQGKLTLKGVQPRVMELLKLTAVDTLMTIEA